MISKDKTARGFDLYHFTDKYQSECSLQKSSLATEDCIWLGVDDANPIILARDATILGIPHNENCGWVKYSIPEEVSLSTRMHLTREMAGVLAEKLKVFSETGELP